MTRTHCAGLWESLVSVPFKAKDHSHAASRLGFYAAPTYTVVLLGVRASAAAKEHTD